MFAIDRPSIPATYALQPGEYPYCIARRFDIDPTALLQANDLTGNQNFYTGLVLSIPKAGPKFPGDRQLQPHPALYTVISATETFYTVACKYGDIDPETIAEANQLSVDSSLSVGQQLTIP